MHYTDLPKHHAILIETHDRKSLGSKLFNQLQATSLFHRYFDQTVLDIDTVRSIISWVKAPYHENRVLVLSFSTIGIEAQNSLLKVLEEPPENFQFLLCTTNSTTLLPTVLSRVLVIQHKKEDTTLIKSADADTFLKTSHSTRMKLPFVLKLLKQEDEKGRKDRESFRLFVLSLLSLIPQTNEYASYSKEILTVADYASDASASTKALLEYLALLLPQTKV